MRVGDWKLVAAKGDPWELYDLRTDRAEQHNLAAKMPDKVKELERVWQEQTDRHTRLAQRPLPNSRNPTASKPGPDNETHTDPIVLAGHVPCRLCGFRRRGRRDDSVGRYLEVPARSRERRRRGEMVRPEVRRLRPTARHHRREPQGRQEGRAVHRSALARLVLERAGVVSAPGDDSRGLARQADHAAPGAFQEHPRVGRRDVLRRGRHAQRPAALRRDRGDDAGRAHADRAGRQRQAAAGRPVPCGGRTDADQLERHRRPDRTPRHRSGLARRRASLSERREEAGGRPRGDRQHHGQGGGGDDHGASARATMSPSRRTFKTQSVRGQSPRAGERRRVHL